MKSACVHFIHGCALCRAVLALRSWQAYQWNEAHPAVQVRRCPDCGFCYGEHAPDCGEAKVVGAF